MYSIFSGCFSGRMGSREAGGFSAYTLPVPPSSGDLLCVGRMEVLIAYPVDCVQVSCYWLVKERSLEQEP